MRQLFVTLLIAVSLVAGARLSAHHSFVATYLEGEKGTIEGEVTNFLLRNPHSFLFVSVTDDMGEAQEWAVECGSGTQMRGEGITIDTLKPGDHVVVTGDPSRTPGEARLRMRQLERPADGWSWGGDFD